MVAFCIGGRVCTRNLHTYVAGRIVDRASCPNQVTPACATPLTTSRVVRVVPWLPTPPVSSVLFRGYPLPVLSAATDSRAVPVVPWLPTPPVSSVLLRGYRLPVSSVCSVATDLSVVRVFRGY